jgi:hypothetical protein
MDKVLIWLILTQDFFGSAELSSSKVRGNPAFCGWLVIATAITVPEWVLNTSWLRMSTGRNPACSWPTVGFRFAK